MSATFEERLNRILPRIITPEFLANRGQGNEIGFWIFDYLPEREPDARAFASGVVLPALERASIKAAEINLFQLIIGLLEERKLLDKALKMQASKGDEAVLAELRAVLTEAKLAKRIGELVNLDEL